MLSRKMCVLLLFVLTILWGLAAGNVQAQGQNENKGSSGNIPVDSEDKPAPNATQPATVTVPVTVPIAPSTGAAAGASATPATPRKPEKSENRRSAIRATGGGYGVMVGPNGQVLEFGEGGGSGGGGFGGGSGAQAEDGDRLIAMTLIKHRLNYRRSGGTQESSESSRLSRWTILRWTELCSADDWPCRSETRALEEKNKKSPMTSKKSRTNINPPKIKKSEQS